MLLANQETNIVYNGRQGFIQDTVEMDSQSDEVSSQ